MLGSEPGETPTFAEETGFLAEMRVEKCSDELVKQDIQQNSSRTSPSQFMGFSMGLSGFIMLNHINVGHPFPHADSSRWTLNPWSAKDGTQQMNDKCDFKRNRTVSLVFCP